MLWRRLRDEQDGVTLVIVVLSLIALFGMLVLVVDVGGLMLRRRAMVNASDAAALAAAKSCVRVNSTTPDSFTPEAAADQWAASNSEGVLTGLANITGSRGCVLGSPDSDGFVSVQYSADQQLFFAPVLGFGNSGGVTTDATAIWGAPGAANPIPIVVYSNSFNDCKLDADPTPGGACYIWEDNNNTQGSQSGFGFLDLRTGDPGKYGWDSNAGAACSDPGNGNDGPKGWLETYPSTDIGDLGVNYPAPTYVCRVSGDKESAWVALEQLVDDDDTIDNNDDEDILFFPINRCDTTVPPTYGQIDSGGGHVICGDTPHQYDIIGFVALKLKAVYKPLDVQPSYTTCPSSGLIPRAPASTPLSLNTLGIVSGCFSGAPSIIDSSSVSWRKTTGPAGQRGIRGPDVSGSVCAAGPGQLLTQFDYCYNPTTRMLYWNAAGPAADTGNYNVEFTWSAGGPCGIPPALSNAGHCLVVEVVEKQIGGSRPGQGDPNSNLRAYKLCDEDIPGSCDPIQVP